MEAIEDVRIKSCTSSKYVQPFRVLYKQVGTAFLSSSFMYRSISFSRMGNNISGTVSKCMMRESSTKQTYADRNYYSLSSLQFGDTNLQQDKKRIRGCQAIQTTYVSHIPFLSILVFHQLFT